MSCLEIGTLFLGRIETNDGYGDAYVNGQWLKIKFDTNSVFLVIEYLYKDEYGRHVMTLLSLQDAYKFSFRGSIENIEKMCEIVIQSSIL
jgi:hypothetical protein